MSAAPLVTVVTPAFDAAGTLGEAIASVQAQDMPDWEMLVVDDASTDATRAVAGEAASRDARVRALGLDANRGAAEARNHAIRRARGRYVAFLDADDLWEPEKLTRQIAAMRASGCPLAFSSYRRTGADGADLGVVRARARVTRADMLRVNLIGCLTAIYDTEVFGRAEMPAIRRRQDYGLWLGLLRATPFALGLPEVLAEYRVRAGSLSSGRLAAAWANWRLYRDLEEMPVHRAAWSLAHCAARSLGRR